MDRNLKKIYFKVKWKITYTLNDIINYETTTITNMKFINFVLDNENALNYKLAVHILFYHVSETIFTLSINICVKLKWQLF